MIEIATTNEFVDMIGIAIPHRCVVETSWEADACLMWVTWIKNKQANTIRLCIAQRALNEYGAMNGHHKQAGRERLIQYLRKRYEGMPAANAVYGRHMQEPAQWVIGSAHLDGTGDEMPGPNLHPALPTDTLTSSANGFAGT